MANSIFNSAGVPGTFDRQILVQFQSQPVAVANPGRTYWLLHNLNPSSTLYVSVGTAHGNGVGSIKLLPGESIDSSVIPELTQAAIFVCGDTRFDQFTFEEVAAAQSAQQ